MIGNHLEPFKFWCQKVLPNVYDDSLSYYEYLCKLNEYLNEVIGQINTLTDNMEDYESDLSAQWSDYKDALNAEWSETKNYIDNYFNNLDVQQEINNKLDQMAQSGTLSTLLAPIVSTQIGGVVAQQIDGAVAGQIDNSVAGQIVPVVAEQLRGSYGSPLVASTVAQMTDRQRVYVYTGSEGGYISGNWYYWNGTAWTSGGVYNSEAITIDTKIDINSSNAVENKVIAKRVDEIESGLNGISYKSYTGNLPVEYTESSQSFLIIPNTPIGEGYLETLNVFIGSQTNTIINLYNLSDDGETFELKHSTKFDSTSGDNAITINKYFDKPIYVGFFTKARYTSTPSENPTYIFSYSATDVDIDDALNTTYSQFYVSATFDKVWNNIINTNNELNGHSYSTYTALPSEYSVSGQSFIQLNPISVGKGYISKINVFLSAVNNTKILIYNLSNDETKYEIKKIVTFNAVDGLNEIAINYYSNKDVYVGLFGYARYVGTPNENPNYVFNYSTDDLLISSKLATTYSHFFYTVTYQGMKETLYYITPLTKSNNFVVVSKTGEYDTIQKGINAVEANGTVLVLPGTYLEQIDTRAKNVNIVGVDKNMCILKDTSGMYDTPPLEISGGSIQNMTIIETSEDSTPSSSGNNPTLAYCIHIDFNQETNNKLLISNCILRSYKRACIGCGVRNGFNLMIENCDIWSGVQEDTGHLPRGAFYVHTQSSETPTPIANITLKDNIIACEDTLTLCLEDYGGIGFSLTSINNMIYSAVNGKTNACIKGRNDEQFAWSSYILNNARSYGNNVALLNA